MAKLSQKLTKYGRGCPAGTGGHPESGTPSKVRSRALVCRSTVSHKNQGDPPPLNCHATKSQSLNFGFCQNAGRPDRTQISVRLIKLINCFIDFCTVTHDILICDTFVFIISYAQAQSATQLQHNCHNVLVVLQLCHSCVTVVSHLCHICVTVVSQLCHSCVVDIRP